MLCEPLICILSFYNYNHNSVRNVLTILPFYTEGTKAQRITVRIYPSENLNSWHLWAPSRRSRACPPRGTAGSSLQFLCPPTSDCMPTAQWTPELVGPGAQRGKGSSPTSLTVTGGAEWGLEPRWHDPCPSGRRSGEGSLHVHLSW